MKSTKDFYGKTVNVGDMVMCLYHHYKGQHFGQRSRVIDIEGTNLRLSNSYNEDYPTSLYRAQNFKLVEKKVKEPEPMMIPVAIRLDSPQDTTMDITTYLEERSHFFIITADTVAILKTKIQQRIKDNPHERWLILNAHSIAEIDNPPVRFRDI